jgi:hypothetical protein
MWLDPVATDREATFDPGLLGVWSETGGRDLLIFRRNGDSAYTTKYGADDRAHSDDIARMERVAPLVLPPAR